jgi:hypothetical protein
MSAPPPNQEERGQLLFAAFFFPSLPAGLFLMTFIEPKGPPWLVAIEPKGPPWLVWITRVVLAGLLAGVCQFVSRPMLREFRRGSREAPDAAPGTPLESGADKDTEDALKKARAVVVEKVTAKTYLLDCGKEKPHDVVQRLPGHQGAINFHDGEFKEALGYRTRKGAYLVPQPYASLRWGSTFNAIKQMEQDIERYSKLPGVGAEKVNTRPGERVFGNPWMPKLTPAKGKTLLEVFVLTKAGFDFKEGKEPGK